MKTLAVITALLCLTYHAGAQEVLLHDIFDMNTAPAQINSHVGEEGWSRLQPMHSYTKLIGNDFLLGSLPGFNPKEYPCSYPRLKKMADGRFILFYMPQSHGSSIYYTISEDLLSWSDPVLLLESYKTEIKDKEVQIRYVNMDAAVLPDGDLLGVCQFWCREHYSAQLGTGIVTVRSSDNGKTWTSPQVIYEGSNWEPYLLVLPDGKIHCYFTDSTPETWNSGVSLMVSEDNGRSWSPKMRVCRSYKYEYDKETTLDKSIYTDQMPSFRVLNDGKTLIGFLEARLANPPSNSGKTYHRMSVVYNDGFEWKDLGEDSEGPADRHTWIMGGAAGYVETFPSGEVAISCGRGKGWSIKLLDHTGGRDGKVDWEEGWFVPFNKRGGWGAIERINDNMLVSTAGESRGGIWTGLSYLNNTITAKKERITVDGNPKEWRNDDALYLGSKDGSETVFRAAYGRKHIHLLTEILSPAETDPVQEIILCNEAGEKVTVRYDEKGCVEGTSEGLLVKTRKGRTSKGTEGYCAEISVPLSMLKTEKGEFLKIYAETGDGETFTDASKEDSGSWLRIHLK